MSIQPWLTPSRKEFALLSLLDLSLTFHMVAWSQHFNIAALHLVWNQEHGVKMISVVSQRSNQEHGVKLIPVISQRSNSDSYSCNRVNCTSMCEVRSSSGLDLVLNADLVLSLYGRHPQHYIDFWTVSSLLCRRRWWWWWWWYWQVI